MSTIIAKAIVDEMRQVKERLDDPMVANYFEAKINNAISAALLCGSRAGGEDFQHESRAEFLARWRHVLVKNVTPREGCVTWHRKCTLSYPVHEG